MKIFISYVQNKKKQIPENLVFRCAMTHFSYSLKKLGKTFKIQKEKLKTEMNHDKTDENNWRDERDERVDYVKNKVLCTVFSYARYCKAMEDITGFSMKDCLSLPGLGWNYFNSMKTEEDEPYYTYNDKYMRCFVLQPIKRERRCAFHQFYKSENCDDILKNISEELNVKRNI